MQLYAQDHATTTITLPQTQIYAIPGNAGSGLEQTVVGASGTQTATGTSGAYAADQVAINRPVASPTPTPPALVNPQNPVTLCGAGAGGDDTACFQQAWNAGDLNVPAGTFKILGTVFQTPGTTAGKNIRCASITTTHLQGPTSDTVNFVMFNFNGTVGGSVFNCHFRGPNAGVNAHPLTDNSFQMFIQHNAVAGVGSNLQINGNDFDGIGGFIAAINLYANDANQPGPQNDSITYNTFEHCGFYGVQVTSGRNTLINHNTLNDCAGMIEPDDNGQVNTGNVVDSNHMTCTYGNGQSGGPSPRGACYFSAGIIGGSKPFDFSGNTLSNNIVDGSTTVPPGATATSCLIEDLYGFNHGPGQTPATVPLPDTNQCNGGCRKNIWCN
jgi:hypothetical protein